MKTARSSIAARRFAPFWSRSRRRRNNEVRHGRRFPEESSVAVRTQGQDSPDYRRDRRIRCARGQDARRRGRQRPVGGGPRRRTEKSLGGKTKNVRQDRAT